MDRFSRRGPALNMARARQKLLEYKVPIAIVLAGVAWIGWLLTTQQEISAWADFRRDVVVRDGSSPEVINDIRFYDSSPYSIWLPSDLFVWESLRQLELPLWDRRQAGGYSPILNLQNGVLHPIRLIAVVFPRELASSAIIVVSLLTLCLGTFGMLRVAFGTSESGALLGALVVVFSGYVASIAHFSGMLTPVVHTPWLVWMFFAWAKSRSTRTAIGFATTVALLIVSGHPLIIVAVLSIAAVLIGWKSLAEGRRRELLFGTAIGATGALLTSVCTLPMLINLSSLWSYKNATPEGISYGVLSHVGQFDALLSVLLYRPYPTDLIDGGPIVFHLGIAAFVLMAAGFFVAIRERATWIVAILAIVGWTLAVPAEWSVDLLARTPLAYFKPWYLVVVLIFPAAIAVALGSEKLLVVARPRLRAPLTVAMIAAVVLPGLRLTSDVLRAHPIVETSSPALRFLERQNEPFRVVGLSGQTHVPNVSSITGIEDVRFSSPVHPERYHRWIQIAAPSWGEDFPSSTIIHDANSPLLRAFNVRFVLRSTVPGHDVQTFLARPGLKAPAAYFTDPPPDEAFLRVFDGGSVAIYEATEDLHPRAHFAEKFVVVSGGLEEAVRIFGAAGRDEAVEVVELPGGKAGLLDKVAAPVPGDEARVTYPRGNRVEISTRTAGSRLLVLHDSWDRGWRARIDGVSTELFPVSVLSRGVVVPAGAHTVEMAFIPRGTTAGAVISLIAAGVCVILAMHARRSQEGP